MPSRIQIAKQDIVKLFESNGPRLYSHSECAQILDENRGFWRLAQRMNADDFIAYLLDKTSLRRIELKSLIGKPAIVRYAWGEVSVFRVALSARRHAYFSHGTAVFLHGLTDQLPKVLYVNEEQSAKPSIGQLHVSQEALDAAFRRPQRESNQAYDHGDYRLYVLNGKHTGRLEVGEMLGPDGEPLAVTKLERTLIDITVRPSYGGGVHKVLEAYQAAKDRVSTNTLVATLKKLDFTYPYHQAIGFLMARAGYEPHRLDLIRRMGLKMDFYLAHGMAQTTFDRDWRLHVPVDF